MIQFPDAETQINEWEHILERIKGKKCRTCVHRLRFELNDHSNKIVQCCKKQPSKRSNSGYKTIKVTNDACANYKE